MGFVFEFDAKNNVLRGTIKDRPETIRLRTRKGERVRLA
jgi:hypothetical protein